MKKIKLVEQLLFEDKVVKFNGEVYPKFGWCVILMGGAASGKGTAFNTKIPIDGDYYNPDNLKEIERMWNIPTYDTELDNNGKIINQSSTGKTHADTFSTPEGGFTPDLVITDDPNEIDGQLSFSIKNNKIKGHDSIRNMKNRDFVSELHGNMDDLSKRWKKSVYTTPEGVDKNRLPNLIFDITAKKLSSIDDIISAVKPVGYKVAIVWMLTKAELAIANNKNRARSVDDEILIGTHLGVMDTAEHIFSSGYITNVDEFWVIDTATDFNPTDKPKEYHDTSNVYPIPCTPDGLQTVQFVVDRIAYNRPKFKRELIKVQNKKINS